MRMIQYRGTGRTETLKEQEDIKGYACGFEGLIGYVNGLLPANEVIEQALRKTVSMFPELAVRELVANAIIHQDFFVTGAGPMVEIFDDRIGITNPGESLVDTERFVDTPPRSRNESLASLMRRFRICEERGSGIDKVVFEVELFQLPAPLFEKPDGFTRTVLFAHKPFSAMDKADRVRACYLHACLRYVTRKPMTNTSVRERFGIAEKNASMASRLLSEAVKAGLIVVEDPEAGTRIRSYLPFWAAPRPSPRGSSTPAHGAPVARELGDDPVERLAGVDRIEDDAVAAREVTDRRELLGAPLRVPAADVAVDDLDVVGRDRRADRPALEEVGADAADHAQGNSRGR